MNLRPLSLILFTLSIISLPLIARDADMEKAAERYIRSLLKEVPELAGEKNSRDARADILAAYKKYDVLRLSAELRKRIERRQNPVPEEQYNSVLENLKQATTQNDEVKFIIKSATQKGVNGELRLILFRLMEQHIDDDIDIRKNTLNELLKASRAYKSEHNKYAEKISDLIIYEDIKKFKDGSGKTHDWLYLGGTVKPIQRSSSRLLFCEPVANSEGDALAINARGSRIIVNLDMIKKEMAQPVETPKLKAKPTQKNKATPKAIKKIEPKITYPEVINYSSILKSQMKDIMILYFVHTIQNKEKPNSMEDLKLPPKLIKSTSPDNQSTKEWIFVPNNQIIDAAGDQIIFASPYMHNDEHYYIATANGKIEAILPSDHQKILERIKSK